MTNVAKSVESITKTLILYLNNSKKHLFFECESLKSVWKEILRWTQINHIPGGWHSEVKWLSQQTKGKGARAAVLKMSVSETVYEIWKARNNKIFGETIEINTVGKKIIDTLV